MQKVVTINILPHLKGNEDFSWEELEFPKITEYLEAGYSVKDVYPLTAQTGNYTSFTVVFILQKSKKGVRSSNLG